MSHLKKLKIAHKLVILLMVSGLVPALALFAVFEFERSDFETNFRNQLTQFAIDIGDVVDRNLFERYGDVQAFGLNAAAKDNANWGVASDSNPLVSAMNGYMTGYGIYRLMLVLDMDGTVVAANSVNPTGEKLDTVSLYGKSFAGEPWFKRPLKGEFLNGANGLTGTAVEQPSRISMIGELYGDDGYVIPFSAPVKDAGGQTIGVWVNFADFGLVEDIFASFYRGLEKQGKKSAELTLLDPKGRIIIDYDPAGQGWTEYSRNPEVIGKFNLAENVEIARRAVSGESGAIHAVHARKKIEQVAGYTHTDGAYDYPGLGWSVLVRISSDEAYAAINNVHRIMLLALGMAVLVIAGVGMFIGKMSASPIQAMSAAMAKLADGDNEIEVPGLDRQDEIGEMSSAVQVFKDNAIRNKKLEAEQKGLELKAEKEKQRSLHEVASRFEMNIGEIVEAVAGSSAELNTTAQAMAGIAEETSSQATAVAAASEQASANVQTVASATEEMTASISAINSQVADASLASKNAVEDVAATAGQMNTLAQTADKIGEVVSLISDIAEQTNLLALNATIEAARAGEAGKGFAVVASEVKALATQTAKATESISEHIQEIQGATNNAVTSIDDIGKVIKQIEETSSAIAAAMEEQGATTQEVTRNVQEAASGTQEVTSNIAGVTQASQETGAAAGQVTAAAGELSKQSESLKNGVAGFLQELREGSAANRRESDDPNYKGPDRRGNKRENAAA